MATDEWPRFIGIGVDDSFGVYVSGGNIVGKENMVTLIAPNASHSVFSWEKIANLECRPLIEFNQTLLGDEDDDWPDNVTRYNHEYNLFTMPMKRETPTILDAGTYTVKIVIHDVQDDIVDSAVFIEEGSLRLNTCLLQAGDFSGNGLVEQADLDLVLGNWGAPYQNLPGTWIVHRPTGGVVDQEELDQVLGNWGNEQSNMNYRADFNRDGCVNLCDKAILDQWLAENLTSCASIFEGDTFGPNGEPGDGAVDSNDLAVYNQETNGAACNACCGWGQDGKDNEAAGGEPDVWLWTFNYLLSLDAVAWVQFPFPPPGSGPAGPAPTPAPGPAPVPPAPESPQPAPSYSPQPTEPPPLEPIPEAQPQQQQTEAQTQSQPAEQSADQKPTLRERISKPNSAASGHERYDDIQEILMIAAGYYFNNRQHDAKLIWISVGRVFGDDVLPDAIEIRW